MKISSTKMDCISFPLLSYMVQTPAENSILFEVEFTNQSSHFVYSLEVMAKLFDKDPAELFLAHAFKTVVSSQIADKVIDFFKNKLIVVSDYTLKKINLTFFVSDMSDKDFLAWNKTLDGFVKTRISALS